MHVADAELLGAALDDFRAAARDDGGQHARLAQEHEALPLPHSEALELVAPLRLVDAAVGEHAVEVHDQQLHAGQPHERGFHPARGVHASGLRGPTPAAVSTRCGS